MPSIRHLSTSSALQYTRKASGSTIRVPSKKAQAAKAKRKAALAAKEDERYLKLTLEDAISVLRVCHSIESGAFADPVNVFRQAVEVASPKSTYELIVKTRVGNGAAVPRGRVSLPREAKPKGEDKILVFAEGRLAEDAKKAGAHIVGGVELIDGVSIGCFILSLVETC